jgi:hypothetical protein
MTNWMISRTTRDGSTTLDYSEMPDADSFHEHRVQVALDLPITSSIFAAVDPTVDRREPITLVCPELGGALVEVRDQSGEAIPAGAYVTVADASTSNRRGLPEKILARIDQGRAKVWPLPVGSDLDIALQLHWNQPATHFRARGPSRQGEWVPISITSTGRLCTISGHLVRPTGEPIVHERWYLTFNRGSREQAWTAAFATDEDGAFRVSASDLETQPLLGRVVLRPRIFLPDPRDLEVELPSINGTGEIDLGDLVITMPEPVVSGSVTDEEGRPLDGATVRAFTPGSASLPGHGLGFARSDAYGRFALYAKEPLSSDTMIEATVEGPWIHEAERVFGKEHGIQLVLRPTGTLEGEVLVDEKSSAASFRVSVWPDSLGPRTSLQIVGWLLGTIDEQGDLRVNHLKPGNYTVAVSINANDRDAIFFENVIITPGRCSDPRLSPLDLRGRARPIKIVTCDENGVPVNALAHAILTDGSFMRLTDTRQPILLPVDKTIATILVHAEGYFPESLGPVEGTREVVLRRGLDVTLAWSGSEPLPESPYSLVARLETVSPQPEIPGGRAAASYVRDAWSPSHGSFAPDGRLVLKVREPGRYKLSWKLRFERGFVHEEAIDVETPTIDVIAGRVDVHPVSIPPSALRAALQRARRVVDRVESSSKR